MDKIEGRASFSLQARGPKKPYRILGMRQQQVIDFLLKNAEPVSLSTLVRELDIYDKHTAFRVVLTLERRGLVIRYGNVGTRNKPTIALNAHSLGERNEA